MLTPGTRPFSARQRRYWMRAHQWSRWAVREVLEVWSSPIVTPSTGGPTRASGGLGGCSSAGDGALGLVRMPALRLPADPARPL